MSTVSTQYRRFSAPAFYTPPAPHVAPARSADTPVYLPQISKSNLQPGQLALHLGLAAFSMVTARLLHRLPQPNIALKDLSSGWFKYISADWKDYARVGLGAVTVNELNASVNQKPPLWFKSLETLGVLSIVTPEYPLENWRQSLVLATVIPGVVAGGTWISNHIAKPLKDRAHIPDIATHLGITVLGTLTSILVYPRILTFAAKNLLGQYGKQMLENAAGSNKDKLLGWGGTCASGCCSTIICLNEAGALAISTGNWIKNSLFTNNQSRRSP